MKIIHLVFLLFFGGILWLIAEQSTILQLRIVTPQRDSTTHFSKKYEGYTLVWSDEFDIDGAPDSGVWDYESGYVRNNEAQYYTNNIENSWVENGCLNIAGRKNHLGYPYTSASLHTRNSHFFTYGIFEIRAKIPYSDGCWPAIWTVGNKYSWPIGGEIDLMEFYDKSILANAAWSSDKPYTPIWDSEKIPMTHWTNADSTWMDKFHIWRMDWDRNWINLYLDDELLNSIVLDSTHNKGWKGNFDNPFRFQEEDFGQYFIINLALGGNNGGRIDDASLPARYYIDYIRAYQKTNEIVEKNK